MRGAVREALPIFAARQAAKQITAGCRARKPRAPPGIAAASASVSVLERSDGRCARPEDLVMLAAHLGECTAVLRKQRLPPGPLNQPYPPRCAVHVFRPSRTGASMPWRVKLSAGKYPAIGL